MIDQIFDMLKDKDPMERDRVIDAVKVKLDTDRKEKLAKAKAEVFKYEKK